MTETTRTRIPVTGRVFWKGDPGYEQARRGAVWNERKPERFPDVIVLVEDENDTVEAVRYARAQGLKAAIRSGGHSMCGAGVRDGGMLIDLSRLKGVTVDPLASIATVEPSVTAGALAAALAEHSLGFPVGHASSVAMGGYLLAGGLGWNMGAWGPACFSIRSIRVVTADGKLVVADARHNEEIFWAARGAGSGFFGVVTSFELAVYPIPAVIRTSTYLYPFSDLEAIARWAPEAAASSPESLEMVVLAASAPPGLAAGPAGKMIGVTAIAFADDEIAAERLASVLGTCPVSEHALVKIENQPATFANLQAMIDGFLPAGRRFAEDTIWSNESVATVLPVLGENLVRAPSSRSLVMAPIIRPHGAGLAFPDAAFSMTARSLVLCYGIWDDARDDDRNEEWMRHMVGDAGRFTVGRYIAENDLLADPSRPSDSFAPANWDRLETMRKKFDPTGVFHTYLGTPDRRRQDEQAMR